MILVTFTWSVAENIAYRFRGVAAAFSTQVSKRKSLESAQANPGPATKEPTLQEEVRAPEIFEDDGWRQRNEDMEERDFAAPEPIPAPTARDRALRFHESQFQGKENLVRAQNANSRAGQRKARPAFIDRQANATRIASIDSSQENSPAAPGVKSNGKRPLVTEEEEEEEVEEEQLEPTPDVSFQSDSRVQDFSRRRGLPSSHRPRKRQQSNQPSRAPSMDDNYEPPGLGEDEDEDEDEDEQQAGQENGEQSAPNVTQQAPHASSYRATAQLAKQMVAAVPRTTQKRRPWSLEAENRLIELVATFGSGYAAIKRADEASNNFFEGRDQVALKDKCRTMRFNYHKYVFYALLQIAVLMVMRRARQNLPRGFDQIPLKSEHKVWLDGRDIAY